MLGMEASYASSSYLSIYHEQTNNVPISTLLFLHDIVFFILLRWYQMHPNGHLLFPSTRYAQVPECVYELSFI